VRELFSGSVASSGSALDHPAPAIGSAIDKITTQSAHDYRPDIDGLRAIAVVSVVLFHFGARWLPGGFVGVDIFFVISGFLITSIILQGVEAGKFSLPGFYAKRIRRIFPALILVMLASWSAGWHFMTAEELRELGSEIIAGVGFFANIHFWRSTDYFSPTSDVQPLLHLWSLGVEEQFYLFWPVVLLISRGRRLRLISTASALIFISFFVNVLTVNISPEAAFYLPQSRLWELLLGALLALDPTSDSRWQSAKSFVGAVLVVSGLFCIDKTSSFPGWWALMPTVGAAFLIWAGPTGWVNRSLLSNRIAVGIGLISYPLYLWHWPLLAFARNIQNGEPTVEVRTAIIGCALLLSWATYALLEKPIRFSRRHRKRSVRALAICAAIVFSIGLVTVQANGFANRFPEIVRDLASYSSSDIFMEYRLGTCFLRRRQLATDFQKFCQSNGDVARGILLWGDSHAADLYPGLRKVGADRDLPLAQYNATSCPPILGFHSAGRPNCPEINDVGMQQITRLKPGIVVLSADWPKYESSPDMANFESTIGKLREAGVTRIVMIGPVPHWRPLFAKNTI
jgi:peptidoglycan/LPS O-acetylase OafA/YrhL